ncbi:MAG: glycosyltransferase family 2 protein [Planctomycetota bacterium]
MAWLMAVSLGLSLLAGVMTLINTPVLKRRRRAPAPDQPIRLSVCIPARDEEANIEAAVRSVLDQAVPEGVTLEVLIYDDESTDRTPEIVDALVAADSRVRRAETAPMPAGWTGKQWACARLAEAASGDWLLFVDADVRLQDGGLERTIAEVAGRPELGLLSCFPRQITQTLGETVFVPMIHFILLSYLPMPRMRATRDPATCAGCGQFLLIRRQAYVEAGGHAAVRDSMHDGVKIPRNVRRAGWMTDLFDGTHTASCRMYEGWGATWRGFRKNAYEGLGSPIVLGVFTVMHAIGHALPWMYVVWSAVTWTLHPVALPLAIAAVLTHLAHRTVIAAAFQQPWLVVILHPFGVAAMTAVQWASFVDHLRGQRAWRGRTLETPAA